MIWNFKLVKKKFAKRQVQTRVDRINRKMTHIFPSAPLELIWMLTSFDILTSPITRWWAKALVNRHSPSLNLTLFLWWQTSRWMDGRSGLLQNVQKAPGSFIITYHASQSCGQWRFSSHQRHTRLSVGYLLGLLGYIMHMVKTFGQPPFHLLSIHFRIFFAVIETHHITAHLPRKPEPGVLTFYPTRQISLSRFTAHARIDMASFFSRWTTIFNVSALL